MKENLVIFYRTYGSENRAARPSWYSKELCLKSILLSSDKATRDANVHFKLLHDGPMSENPDWTESIKKLVEPIGEIVEMPRMGNSLSSIGAIYRACNLPKDDIVIFAEDDYLWLDNSLSEMVSCISTTPSDYLTGYDHPVRYQPEYPLGADLPHWFNTVYITGSRHWRSQESTCMTFATKVKTLVEDISIFEKYKDNGKGSPEDRELFRELQGLGEYDREVNKRLLLGPMPSLNTHLHMPWLAPIIDWERYAYEIIQ